MSTQDKELANAGSSKPSDDRMIVVAPIAYADHVIEMLERYRLSVDQVNVVLLDPEDFEWFNTQAVPIPGSQPVPLMNAQQVPKLVSASKFVNQNRVNGFNSPIPNSYQTRKPKHRR